MERKICDTPMMARCKERTPEEEIKWLNREVKEARIDRDRAEDRAQQKDYQVHTLLDLACELRDANKNIVSNMEWQGRRMSDYRGIISDIEMKCRDVICDYENKDKGEAGRPNKAVYEFAKTILDICGRV